VFSHVHNRDYGIDNYIVFFELYHFSSYTSKMLMNMVIYKHRYSAQSKPLAYSVHNNNDSYKNGKCFIGFASSFTVSYSSASFVRFSIWQYITSIELRKMLDSSYVSFWTSFDRSAFLLIIQVLCWKNNHTESVVRSRLQ
jgi:hypothetical protein